MANNVGINTPTLGMGFGVQKRGDWWGGCWRWSVKGRMGEANKIGLLYVVSVRNDIIRAMTMVKLLHSYCLI